MKHRANQRGSHHIILTLAAVTLLIAALGFAGYNSWQRQVSDAGDETSLGPSSPLKRPSAENPLEFSAAQYNITHAVSFSGCKDNARVNTCVKARTQAQTSAIQGLNNRVKSKPVIDIATLNEVSIPQYRDLKVALKDYGFYPKQVPSTQGKAIIWNQKKFSQVSGSNSSGTINNMYQNDGKKDTKTSNGIWNKVPWVLLESKENGQKVFVASIHSPNNAKLKSSCKGSKCPRRGDIDKRLHNATQIVKWAQSKIRSFPGALVVVGGDFNDGMTVPLADRGNKKRAYCKLTETAFRHVYDVRRGSNGKCPTNNATIPIDQLYVSRNLNVQAADYQYFKEGSGIGTSHSPLIVRIKTWP